MSLIDPLNRTTRRDWADRGLLREARSGEGYYQRDAAELAAFYELRKELGDFYEAAAAWEGIKPRLQEELSDDPQDIPEDRFIAVFDPEAKTGGLVSDEAEIGPLVMSGPKRAHTFRAVDLTEPIRTVREAFWRAVEARNLRPPQ